MDKGAIGSRMRIIYTISVIQLKGETEKMKATITPKEISKDLMGRIIHDLANRATWSELEDRYGFKRGELRRHCKEKGIIRRDIINEAVRNKKPKTPTLEMLSADIQQGLSVATIAAKYGVSYQAAHFWLKQHGLRWNRSKNPAPPVVELLDMLNYFGVKGAATQYGISVAILNGWRKKYGLINFVKPRKYSIPDNVREYAMKQYYLGLWDEGDIAEEYGIPVASVEADLLEFGLTDDMIQMMPSRDELMKESETMSIRELAKWYGTSQSQIIRWFDALSIKQGVK